MRRMAFSIESSITMKGHRIPKAEQTRKNMYREKEQRSDKAVVSSFWITISDITVVACEEA